MPSERSRAALTRVPAAQWWLCGLAAIVLLLTSIDVAQRGVITRFDESVSRQMLDWGLRYNHAVKPFVYVLTMFGLRGPVLIGSIAAMAYLTWRSRSSEYLLRYVLALAALTVAVYALKDTVHRYPPVLFTNEVNNPDSYPSGHIANATLVWGLVAWSAVRVGVPATLLRTLRLLAVLGPLAVFVGMTLLDYHWFSDFVGGVCVGVLLLAFVTLPVWSDIARHIDRRLPWLRGEEATDHAHGDAATSDKLGKS